MSGKQYHQSLTKQQKMKEERLKKERQQRIRLIMIIAGVVIVLITAVLLIQKWTQPSSNKAIVTVVTNPRPQVDFNSMGDPNAPVKIVEFSDFQCPYCKQFADTTETQLVEQFIKTGQVYFTYRTMGNFVSDNIRRGGVESRNSAMAAYCAGDQGKFWEYKDILYANWLGEDAGSFTDKRLDSMAEALGLNVDEFRQCMDDEKYREQVDQDNQDGQAAGITGTPSFLINGKLLVGAQPFSVFQKEIEAAIQASGN